MHVCSSPWSHCLLFFLFSRVVDGWSVGLPEFYRTPPEDHLQHPAVWTDQRSGAGEWGMRRPVELSGFSWSIFELSFSQTFIFMTVVSFGPLTCSIVTTTRKFFTILGSVILFGNVITSLQWVGTVLVFLGEGGASSVLVSSARRLQDSVWTETSILSLSLSPSNIPHFHFQVSDWTLNSAKPPRRRRTKHREEEMNTDGHSALGVILFPGDFL